jgi:Tfp pilus assembly protein PilV
MTLTEILIALFVFLMGILGVLSLFPVAMRTASNAMGAVRGNSLSASMLAQIQADAHAVFYEGDGEVDNETVNTAAATTTTTLVANSTPGWTVDDWQGYFVTITDSVNGAGKYQSRLITTNTDDTLTVSPAWDIIPQDLDTFVITRLGLPSMPTCAVDNTNSPDASNIAIFNGNLTADQWIGYRLVVTKSAELDPGDSNPIQGIWRTITTNTADVITLDAALPITPADNDIITIVNPRERDGYVRALNGDSIHAGSIPTSGDDVDPQAWTNMDFSASPGWSEGAMPTADQISHFLVITSRRSAGRIFPIKGHTTDAAGDLIDCDFSTWPDIGVRPAQRDTAYKTRNGTTFTIIGNSTFLTSAILSWNSTDTRFDYRFNPFGIISTTEKQVGDDIHFLGDTDKIGSNYSSLAVFSDNAGIPEGPVRVDIFVFDGYDNVKLPYENRRPVAHITGYIGRP